MKEYRKAPAASSAEFCETPTAALVRGVIDLTRQIECMGAVIGAPGVGKTTVLQRYASEHRAPYVVVNPAQATMPRMLACICEALGEPTGTVAAASLHDRICMSLRWRRRPVLLVDEAQHLGAIALNELRCIHDEAGIPVMVAGNEDLRPHIAELAQLASRIGPRATLTATTAADVEAVARHHGITDAAALAWLAGRSIGRAGLRVVERLMRTAHRAAGTDPITVAHLEAAIDALGGAA